MLVRERLVEGDSNVEVVDYVVDRYGEYVLLKPHADGIEQTAVDRGAVDAFDGAVHWRQLCAPPANARARTWLN